MYFERRLKWEIKYQYEENTTTILIIYFDNNADGIYAII